MAGLFYVSPTRARSQVKVRPRALLVNFLTDAPHGPMQYPFRLMFVGARNIYKETFAVGSALDRLKAHVWRFMALSIN